MAQENHDLSGQLSAAEPAIRTQLTAHEMLHMAADTVEFVRKAVRDSGKGFSDSDIEKILELTKVYFLLSDR